MKKLHFDPRKYGPELLLDTVDMTEFAPGNTAVSPDFYTIACLAKSQGVFFLDQQTIVLQDSTFLFIPPGAQTQFRDSQFIEGIWIFFEGAFLDTFFNEQFFTYKFDFFHQVNAPYHLYTPIEAFTSLFSLVKEIHQETRDLKPDSDHLLRAALYLILTKLNRQYAQTYSTHGEIISDLRVLKIKHLLASHIREIHTVQQMAQRMGISKTYLNQLCQSYLGKSPAKLIKERLLLEAKKEIRFSAKDMAEVAYHLNFSDPGNFTRFFRQATGSTPIEYRREWAN